MTIGKFATQCLRSGKSAKETLALVKKVYKDSNTSIKCIYYYASKAGVKLAKQSQADPKALKEALAGLKAA